MLKRLGVPKSNGTSTRDAGVLRYVLRRLRDATLGQAIGLFGIFVTVKDPIQHFQKFPLCFVGLTLLGVTLIIRAIETPRLIQNFDALPIRTVEFRFAAIVLMGVCGWGLSAFAILQSVSIGSETALLVFVIITAVGVLGSAIACYWRWLLFVYVTIIWAPIIHFCSQMADSRLLLFMVPAGFFVFLSGRSFRKMLDTIEDRYRLEQESRLHFYRALNAMPIRLLILDSKLDVTFLNDGFKSLLAGPKSRDSAVPPSLIDIDPDLHALVHRIEAQTSSQFELKLGTEEKRWQLVTVRYLSDTKETIIAAADIDDRKIAEQRELSMRAVAEASSRLSTMGTVAAGIAHEINNPLAIILASVERLIEFEEAGRLDPKRADVLKRIAATGQRIAKIVRSVRALGRDGRQDPITSVSLYTAVDDTLYLFDQRLKLHGIVLRQNIPKDVSVLCRGVEVVQILTNLIGNAIDAVSLEGDPNERWIELSCTKSDSGRIQIAVSNGGTRIPEAIILKIWTPFFTTKPIGSGTGLGLSIAKNLAVENGGELEFDPRAKNTRFVLSLASSKASESIA